ncbi:cellulose-binding protein [Sphaerisporangium krabiense]|uniref:Chitin-binding protein n=1 Tax=Sphaerisporangium krabiense TaxID=763782 RepID=A0A7W8ZDA2_9ACTN|nr:lytic polysaccharide monooxygenase [Sphaerisporangium krabiense]MBB5631603.1 chitin-binding protein [Sphaerisporangium krabiense]GII61017.1 cellulose-binding protein [Sphaerisporangium krabiense]
MRRVVTLLSSAAIAAASVVFVATPASAHGYIVSPPSRQANCAQGKVSNCGQIIWEPASVEGPKGLKNCSGGDGRWAPLDDDSKAWPVAKVSDTVNFQWTIEARHATSTWEYYVGGTRIAVFDDKGRLPGSTVSHTVSLGGRTGRIKLLAIWNIADTAMAFYNCVDLQVGPGGGDPTPTPTPTITPTVTPTPTPTRTPTPTPTVVPTGPWTAGTAYTVGSQVTYNGATYRCLQPHTALPGWEPPNVPALWARV